ncbi:hypothetical protein ACIA8G_04465 [Lentzea sp. NPDC051213]|uniref:hypothetical protein n=1 Tax=Lentzea sp. NPDC051213 TaxID=3364126 RepID=UPI003795DB11
MSTFGLGELFFVLVVGLIVVGPEHLPGLVRSAARVVTKLKGVFSGISRDIQREIDPESVLPTREELGLLGHRPGPYIVGELPPDWRSAQAPNPAVRREVES